MDELYRRLKEALPELEKLSEEVHGHWGIEDIVYRYYHHSFKTYRAQELTKSIVDALQNVLPESPLSAQFQTLIEQGTGKTFSPAVNRRWDEETRPMIEALLHATYFLDMAVKYAREEEPGQMVSSGYAALLTLYGRRYTTSFSQAH